MTGGPTYRPRALGRLLQFLFYGSPKQWYLELTITPDNRQAAVDWLSDRAAFHTWLTSIVTATIVLLTALSQASPPPNSSSMLKATGIGLMLLSVVFNMICLWSLPNWKYHVRTGLVTDGTRMRLDLELVTWMAIAAFLVGLGLAVIAVLAP